MAKGTGKKDPFERVRRKLTKAQMELSVAEEEHAQARVRGKQEIEQARLRAAKWLTKTGKRVDRRAAQVAKLEDRLASLAPTAEAMEPAGASSVEQPLLDGAAPRGEAASLRFREQRALDVLQQDYAEQGATATEWKTATGMSEATFLRARKELTDRGLVARDGDARKGARYRALPGVAEGNGRDSHS